ncbi:MAG: YdcF family protein [Pseudorhodoplanes sp.]|nr:YdcF family protein [Pseudorhodoplanes sp.]
MLFALSKALAFFTQPSNVLFLVVFAGIVLMATRHARVGRRIVVVGVLVMMALGLSPLGPFAVLTLEDRFPPWDPSRGDPEGIVVLGGSISPEISAARNEVSVGASAERLTVIPELARRYPNAKIVFTGGSANLFGGEREADYADRLLATFGLPPGRVIVERDARNTVENAELTKALVKPKSGERWLLITSSWHMPRAVGVFRKAGFDIEPYPVDWISTGKDTWLRFPGSFVGGLRAIDEAAHEWIGLTVYWLTGRSSELFPGPKAAAGCDTVRQDGCRK